VNWTQGTTMYSSLHLPVRVQSHPLHVCGFGKLFTHNFAPVNIIKQYRLPRAHGLAASEVGAVPWANYLGKDSSTLLCIYYTCTYFLVDTVYSLGCDSVFCCVFVLILYYHCMYHLCCFCSICIICYRLLWQC